MGLIDFDPALTTSYQDHKKIVIEFVCLGLPARMAVLFAKINVID